MNAWESDPNAWKNAGAKWSVYGWIGEEPPMDTMKITDSVPKFDLGYNGDPLEFSTEKEAIAAAEGIIAGCAWLGEEIYYLVIRQDGEAVPTFEDCGVWAPECWA